MEVVTIYDEVMEHVENNMLRKTKMGDFELFCYTKECFWGVDTWNEITETHRGALYYKGVPVNKPFRKIFNLNERPETQFELVERRMLQESYNIYDKANGHLFMISAFPDENNEQQIMFHTKGGLPNAENDLLNDDIKIFMQKYGDRLTKITETFPAITLMFEALVEHDKHSMYDQQVEMYGETNTFVLLAANTFIIEGGVDVWTEFDYNSLTNLADFINLPVVHLYDEVKGTPVDWLDHTDREGYVIHFSSDGFRVKIKTKEYWQVRFKKDLIPQNILQMFRRSGFDRIRLKLPEEVAELVVNTILEDYLVWFYNVYVGRIPSPLVQRYETLNTESRKCLFTNPDLNTVQKTYLANIADGKEQDYFRSKNTRQDYIKFMYANEDAMKVFSESVANIVDKM